MKDEGMTDLKSRTKNYALRIIKLTSSLPSGNVAQVIGNQILRSGTAVGANYREAFRARSNAEFIAKVGICLQELDETAYWLELLEEAEIIKPILLEELQNETDQLIAIFTTISKKSKAKQNG
jgi:four helix bundle protein